jgi:hypothetical protein
MTAATLAGLPSTALLDPIGLDELMARAALQTRVDRKYVLPQAGADRIVAGLAGTEELRVLEIDGQRDFGYESLYYDTPDLAGFHLAAWGRRRGFKVRRRTYLNSGESFLEVKTRGMRGRTVKERIPSTGTDRGDFVDDVLRRAGLGWVRGRDLRPVLRTAYRRTTLYLPATDDRVTVDTGLSWSLPGDRPLALPGLAIVETKSASAACAADRRLWRAGSRPSRISKYGTGLAALRGDLPDNRWCPVLRRHFSALPTDERTLPCS